MALTKTLFIASPSGFDPNYTFTRTGSAFEIDEDGVLQSKSTDLLRIDYVDLDGDGERETPTFALEDASTNVLIRVDEFDNAAWTKTNMSVEPDAGLAADGSTTADLIVPSTVLNVHSVSQTQDVTASVDHALSVYAAPSGYDFVTLQLLANSSVSLAQAHFELTSSGAVVDSGTLGAGVLTRTEIERLRDGQYRCTLVGQISTSTSADAVYFVAETSSQMAASWAGGGSSAGLGIRMWGAQLEDDRDATTSLMLSSASAATRNADTLFFDYTPAPQEMTVYVKFVERGTIDISAGGIFHIGAADANDDPRLLVFEQSGFYGLRHDNGTVSVARAMSDAPSVGDTVELMLTLGGDGDTQLSQSINSAAVTASAVTGPIALQSAWADTRLYIGSLGVSNQGINEFIDIKIAAGTKTLAEMRSLNPFFGLIDSSIPVAQDTIDNNRQEIGDRGRTFDGTMRETIRSRVSGWSGDTVPLTRSDKNSVQSLLESSTQPQGAFGEMVAGSTGDYPNVYTSIASINPIQSGTERRYVVSFNVEESS